MAPLILKLSCASPFYIWGINLRVLFIFEFLYLKLHWIYLPLPTDLMVDPCIDITVCDSSL